VTIVDVARILLSMLAERERLGLIRPAPRPRPAKKPGPKKPARKE